MTTIRLTLENITPIKNKPGIYIFYNRNNTPVYIGISKVLKHRILSYIEKDDFKEHRTKRALRKEIYYFEYQYMSLSQARKKEKRIKDDLKHNYNWYYDINQISNWDINQTSNGEKRFNH